MALHLGETGWDRRTEELWRLYVRIHRSSNVALYPPDGVFSLGSPATIYMCVSSASILCMLYDPSVSSSLISWSNNIWWDKLITVGRKMRLLMFWITDNEVEGGWGRLTWSLRFWNRCPGVTALQVRNHFQSLELWYMSAMTTVIQSCLLQEVLCW
jgi:hypothetical protein